MIFTQIFRYLDDRDAEEIRRRSTDNSDNSRSRPIADSRFQEFPAENQDNKFGQISCKGAPCVLPERKQTSKTKSPASASLAQGFSTLRAHSSSGPKATTVHTVLPPIAKAPIRTGEERLSVSDKIPAKLPPIDPLTGKARPCKKKPRSCSKMNGETLCENTMSATQYPREDQRRSRTPQDRAGLLNSDGKVQQAVDLAVEATDFLTKDSKSAGNLQKERRRMQFSFDDMSLAKASIKSAFNQRNAIKLDSETTKIVESTQTDEINAEKTSNYLISGQFETNKPFPGGEESRERYRKIGDVYTLLTISEHSTKDGRLSVEQNIEAVKTRSNSSPCVQSAEYLRLQTFKASNNHVRGSLVTEGKTETTVRLVTFDKGRRNAICEVLEKSIGPEYGSSLYDKRQNLMSM